MLVLSTSIPLITAYSCQPAAILHPANWSQGNLTPLVITYLSYMCVSDNPCDEHFIFGNRCMIRKRPNSAQPLKIELFFLLLLLI
ncbi:Uncharacterized protein HZ326_18620 [Fusarium oxysporum f. sp. albedinis]|nr:Uncharacterized protein HZ326_18620 [Fusarium oxysporum f. sp. albedinis]